MYIKKEYIRKKTLTTEHESSIMDVGDLVLIIHSNFSPFYDRPGGGQVGIIVEITHSTFVGVIYYVQTTDGILKFADYELELIDGNR